MFRFVICVDVEADSLADAKKVLEQNGVDIKTLHWEEVSEWCKTEMVAYVKQRPGWSKEVAGKAIDGLLDKAKRSASDDRNYEAGPF